MTIGTKLYIKFFCKEVGRDQFGNIYYQSKGSKKKRIVYYNGIPEASKIPALWNAWLHYTIDELPESKVDYYKWEKTHVPNTTGTSYAYTPKVMKNRTAKKYIAWTPSN
jgi:NADH:ubiquinone oxidoreductase subunit